MPPNMTETSILIVDDEERQREIYRDILEDEGYGAGYKYAHDFDGGVALGETYLPDAIAGEVLYEPTERGEESRIKQRLAAIRGAAAKRDGEA